MPGKNSVALCLIFLCACMAAHAADSPTFVDQKWDDTTRFAFWFEDQGSKIMPLDWFLRLEKADSMDKFAAGLSRYGFIEDTFSQPHVNPSPDTSNRLPLGFAKGTYSGQDWVGLTCAACHTNKITSGSNAWLIEGGASMLNFDLFLSEMVDAIDAITPGSDKERRFWGGAPTGPQQDQFKTIKMHLDQRKRVNTPDFPAGFGRVDAFGHIFNEVLTVGLNTEQGTAKPNAPASYPFLWDISQHTFVQWNNSAPNLGVGSTAVGSLARNIGEVLGVFGEFEVTTKRTQIGLPTYESSVNTDNLKQIEDWISKLRSPKWPAELGPINETDIVNGKTIYKDHCLSCHALVPRNEPVPVPLPVDREPVDSVNTDPQEIDSFLSRTADAGILRGSFYALDPLSPIFDHHTPVRDLTGYVALGVYVNRENPNLEALVHNVAKTAAVGLPHFDTYKGRPLDGIWATAPYLHNGSVASLMELLTPAKDRLPRFCVGDGVFDPINVGYQTYAQRLPDGTVQLNCPPRSSILDTHALGSSNQGHSYGTHLSDVEKQQLLAYLKSL